MPGLTVREMGSQGQNDGNDIIIGDVEAVPLLEDRRTELIQQLEQLESSNKYMEEHLETEGPDPEVSLAIRENNETMLSKMQEICAVEDEMNQRLPLGYPEDRRYFRPVAGGENPVERHPILIPRAPQQPLRVGVDMPQRPPQNQVETPPPAPPRAETVTSMAASTRAPSTPEQTERGESVLTQPISSIDSNGVLL